jgi:hypothetical protein
MTIQQPEADTASTQPGHRAHFTITHRRRTDGHGIAVLGHRIAAVLVKCRGARPEAPPPAGGSTR